MIFNWHEWEVKKRGTVIIIANDITKALFQLTHWNASGGMHAGAASNN